MFLKNLAVTLKLNLLITSMLIFGSMNSTLRKWLKPVAMKFCQWKLFLSKDIY